MFGVFHGLEKSSREDNFDYVHYLYHETVNDTKYTKRFLHFVHWQYNSIRAAAPVACT